MDFMNGRMCRCIRWMAGYVGGWQIDPRIDKSN